MCSRLLIIFGGAGEEVEHEFDALQDLVVVFIHRMDVFQSEVVGIAAKVVSRGCYSY